MCVCILLVYRAVVVVVSEDVGCMCRVVRMYVQCKDVCTRFDVCIWSCQRTLDVCIRREVGREIGRVAANVAGT